MKLCQLSIPLAIFIGLYATMSGQVAVKPAEASSTYALKDLQPGVVVEEVKKNSAADQAGIQAGDVLLSWSRGDSKGEIESPFDVSLIEIEQAPRAPVIVEGLRGTGKRSWTLGPDVWGVRVRPNFQGSPLDLYREGQQLSTAGKPAEAAKRWRVIANQIDGSASVWLLAHAGDAFAEGRQWKEADDGYQEALE